MKACQCDSSGYLDIKGLAVYSSFSPRTLRRILSQPGGPVSYRVGSSGKLLVKKKDWDEWMLQYRQQPADLDGMVDDVLRELEAG